MNCDAYSTIIAAPPRERAGLFATTASRLGTSPGNAEKDFWVCWTLGALYHRLPEGGPRLLFKGGTSLSKAFGLVNRFSEDIDVTIYRDDLGQAATVEELADLSGKKREARLDAIRDAAQAYVTGPLRTQMAAILAEDTSGEGRVEVADDDPDGQTLLIHYPAATPADDGYVTRFVRIESGAKSALDPNRPQVIRPYSSADAQGLDLGIAGVTTIEPGRTFWDKVVIAHGLRRWFENRGEVKGGGNRVTRHYYDLHQLLATDVGQAALRDIELGQDCVAHARTFFNRAPFDLASATPGTFAVAPVLGMLDKLRADYAAMRAMIFGEAPNFDDVMASMTKLEAHLNAA